MAAALTDFLDRAAAIVAVVCAPSLAIQAAAALPPPVAAAAISAAHAGIVLLSTASPNERKRLVASLRGGAVARPPVPAARKLTAEAAPHSMLYVVGAVVRVTADGGYYALKAWRRGK